MCCGPQGSYRLRPKSDTGKTRPAATAACSLIPIPSSRRWYYTPFPRRQPHRLIATAGSPTHASINLAGEVEIDRNSKSHGIYNFRLSDRLEIFGFVIIYDSRIRRNNNPFTILGFGPSRRPTMEVAVTATQGPLRSLPAKLEAALLLLDRSRFLLPKGDKKRIRLLKRELEQLILSEYLMEPSDVGYPTMSIAFWVHEFAEIAYDIDDFVDKLVHRYCDGNITWVSSMSYSDFHVQGICVEFLFKMTQFTCVFVSFLQDLRSSVSVTI